MHDVKLKDLIYTGLSYSDARLYLKNIGFEINNFANTIKIVESTELEPFLHIEGRGDSTTLRDIQFNNVPYELLVDTDAITQACSQLPHKFIGIPYPTSFSFGITVEIAGDGLTHDVRWRNDPLDLVSKIFGASFIFSNE